MVNKAKYLEIKEKLFSKILASEYPNQSFLPTERQLSDIYQVSRITMRAALSLMEEEGLIKRVQGQGTRVTFKEGATKNAIELVAVVSNAFGPFNGDMMSGVNQMAENSNSLVVFKERISEENIFLENGTIHQLIKNKIKNIIVWTQRKPVDSEQLQLVRGLGTNLVFFDTVMNSPYADDISLDNFDAIKTLIDVLNKSKSSSLMKPVFFGCKNTMMSSSIERELAFDQIVGGKKHLINVEKNNWQKDIFKSLEILKIEGCKGIVSANGYLALEIKKQILKSFPTLASTKIVTIDDEESFFMNSQEIDRIAQPYFEFGKKSFELISRQNELGALWKSNKVLLKGELILASEQK